MRLQVSMISFGFSPHLVDEVNPSGSVTHKESTTSRQKTDSLEQFHYETKGFWVCHHLTQI